MGYFNSDVAATTNASCSRCTTTCTAGHGLNGACNVPVVAVSPICVNCISNYSYQPSATGDYCFPCSTVCPGGSQINGVCTITTSPTCVDCPVGKFKSTTDASSCMSCDHCPPYFDRSPYNFIINETYGVPAGEVLPVGVPLGRIIGMRIGSGSLYPVSGLRVTLKAPSTVISIDASTGNILQLSSTDYDLGTRFYSIPIIVTDQGGYTSDGLCTITILDLNDNAPIFSANIYTIYAPEFIENGNGLLLLMCVCVCVFR